MQKVIIIDDDAASIETLALKLEKYEDLELAGTANNGVKGIGLVKTVQPDLLFLDVELPDISGIEFLLQIKNIMSS